MKKLMIIIAALAMVGSFLPGVYAGDTANLNLQVTFAPPSEPLRIWSEPEGPFSVREGELLEFVVIAEDKDTINVELGVEGLPEGAEFIMDPIQPLSSKHREGKFSWIPSIGQAMVSHEINGMPPAPYVASFIARNTEGETASLHVPISVVPGERIIAIELEGGDWILEGVKLGELRNNLGNDGVPIHRIINKGNVPVICDIGYLLPEAYFPEMPMPGFEQGDNRYITKVGETVLPPNSRLKLDHAIEPGMAEPLPLTFGAPLSLLIPNIGLQVKYEIRAALGIN